MQFERLYNFSIFIFLSLLFVHVECSAQEFPPILNYSSKEYNGGNQNWSIDQAANKNIYVANNDGLLEFNGAKWTLYPSPNNTILRSVKVLNDTIYTGSYMDFGYWTSTETGTLSYTSLSAKLDLDLLEDEQIWNIVHQNNWILFQSLNRILIYNLDSHEVQNIDSENTINKIFKVRDKIYFQILKQGLFTIIDGDKKLISDDTVFKNGLVINLFDLPSGIGVVTQTDGLYLLDNDQVNEWIYPSRELINTLTIYSARQSRNGNLILGSISDGIVIIDSYGALIYELNQTHGLSNNTALSLFEDIDGNIWIGLDNGIDCVNAAAPYSTYRDEKGRLGTTYASVLFQGNLYLGTNQGLFYKKFNGKSEFELVKGTNGQVWTLNVLNGTLFCGHNSGTYVVNDGDARQISDVMGTWLLRNIPGTDNLIMQGNYDGLYVLEKLNDTWQLRNKLSGFNYSSKHFEISLDSKILVSHEYKGVYILSVDTDFKEVLSFKRSESVKKSSNSSLAKFSNTIYYACEDGIYQYNPESSEFHRDYELSKVFEDDEYLTGIMVADINEELWIFSKNFINKITKENLGGSYLIDRIPIPQLLHIGNKGYENITELGRNIYLIGTSYGYLILDSDNRNGQSNKVYLNSVKNGNSAVDLRSIDIRKAGEFKAIQNFIEFQYNVPQYNKYEVTTYQYNLDGRMGERWSNWSVSSAHSFENLSHGDYTFKVRARVGNKETENIAVYSFSVLKPFYSSHTAIVLYLIGFFLLALLVNWLYKRYYRVQQERAIESSVKEMELNELAAQKKIIQLKNESLQQDIEARNRELAISTMSMLKKNNTLTEIKNELLKLKDSSTGFKSVIRLINESMNDSDDWKFFEQAFNHADQDFFKKIKELHPQLTTGDLRLCSYLRLNLSSKEIAQLLNISPRSVEIKRYRLRKKINLKRDINLNEYFINL